MNGDEIRLRRVVDAPIEATFHHWTDADCRRRWCAPDPTWTAEAWSDLRVGGAWGVRFGPGPAEMYRVDGVYIDIDAPHRVAYTSTFTYPDGRSFETLTTVELEARGDTTVLTYVDAGFAEGKDRSAFQTGSEHVLDTFERTLRGDHPERTNSPSR